MELEQRLVKDAESFTGEVQLLDNSEPTIRLLAMLAVLEEDDSTIFEDAFPAADRDPRSAPAGEAD